MGQVYVESAAAEHDQGDDVVRVVEAVGRAYGDLDPVVGRLEPGVWTAQFGCPEDVGPMTAGLPGRVWIGNGVWDCF